MLGLWSSSRQHKHPLWFGPMRGGKPCGTPGCLCSLHSTICLLISCWPIRLHQGKVFVVVNDQVMSINKWSWHVVCTSVHGKACSVSFFLSTPYAYAEQAKQALFPASSHNNGPVSVLY